MENPHESPVDERTGPPIFAEVQKISPLRCQNPVSCGIDLDTKVETGEVLVSCKFRVTVLFTSTVTSATYQISLTIKFL